MKQQSLSKKTIREELNFMEEVFERLPYGVIILDINTRRIVNFNQKTCETLGYSGEELLGKSVHDLQVSPDPEETTLAYIEKLLQDGRFDFETQVKKKSGEIRIFRIKVQSLGGSNELLLSTWVDVTEQIRMENELRESEKKYRLITEKMSDIVWMADMNLRVIYVTPSVETVLGFDQEERKKKTVEEQFTPRSLAYGMEVFARELAIEKEGNGDPNRTVTLQLEHYHKDGSIRWVETVIGAIRNEQGLLIGLHGVSRDITERKKVEEELSIKTALLEAQAETTIDGILVVNENKKVILFNKRFSELWRVPRDILNTRDDQKILEYVSWQMKNREEFLNKVYHLYEHGEEESVDEIELADGRCFERYSAPLLSPVGKYYGRIWYFRDITEKKQYERKLKEQTDAMEAAIDGLAILGADQNYTFVNKAHAEIYGYAKEELIGQSWRILYTKEELQRFETEIMPELFQKGFVRVGATGKKKDGSFFPQEVSLTVLDNGGLICAVRDITEQKNSENALRESEEKYRMFAEQSFMGIAIIQDGLVKYANQAVSDIDGYSHDEIMNWTSDGFAKTIHPDDLALVMEQVRKKEAGDPDIKTSYSWRIVAKKGEIKWIESYSKTVSFQGRPADFVIMMDITKRREAEEEKKLAEEERKLLEERLNRAEKMEAIGLLAGGVAHDLNNVLGVVIGYAEMLRIKMGESDPRKGWAKNILDGGQKAAAIIQDLLTLTRRGVPVRKVLNLNKIVAEFENSPEMEKLLAYHPTMQIKTFLEPDLLRICGSPVHLEKTLFNLASNAVEAMRTGGTMTITTANRYLDKPIQGYDELKEGDYVVLSVADTGEGISAEDLRRIFEPFYTKKIMGKSGTGLGLAVVWGTVKDHNGYINVESEINKGSIFTLYFPVTREEAAPETDPTSILEYTGHGESILVVDDVKEQREMAAVMLERLNYKVEAVSSGEEAVEYLKKFKVDLVILDMIMEPGIDGLETYKRILNVCGKQKAIIVSGFSESERVRVTQNLGAGTYVRKPYVIEKLGLAVKEELDRK